MKSLHLLRQEEGKSSLYFGFEISDLRLISQTTAEISKRKQELGKQQIKSKNPKANVRIAFFGAIPGGIWDYVLHVSKLFRRLRGIFQNLWKKANLLHGRTDFIFILNCSRVRADVGSLIRQRHSSDCQNV